MQICANLAFYQSEFVGIGAGRAVVAHVFSTFEGRMEQSVGVQVPLRSHKGYRGFENYPKIKFG